jgi:hypothetical protein
MKGNKMIRMISIMIIVPILLAQLTHQIDLLHAYWLWLPLFAGFNALQSTYTGFCPANKFLGAKKGPCCGSETKAEQ